jgi:hypothetical protein
MQITAHQDTEFTGSFMLKTPVSGAVLFIESQAAQFTRPKPGYQIMNALCGK